MRDNPERGGLMKMRAESHELGESFMQAVIGSDAQHVDEALRSWAVANRDELHELLLQSLNPYVEDWRDYEEKKDTDVVARAFDGLREKFDRNKYKMVLQLSADYLRDEKNNAVRRHPVSEPDPEPVPSGSSSGGGSYSTPSGPPPNDNRSNTLNPNNPASRAAASNRSNQMNPNNPAYRSSRRGR